MPSIAANFGKTGNGKTFRTIEFQKLPHFNNLQPRVVDPHREYVLEKQFKQIDPNCNIFTVMGRISDTYLVVDEAQLYIPTHKMTDQEMRNLLFIMWGCRHRNNYVIFNFGAMEQCAYYLKKALNVMYLGHTDDVIETCDKFGSYLAPRLRESFLKLQETRGVNDHDYEVIINE